MTTLDLIYFNAGGGHRAAAQALQQVIAEQRRPWRVRCTNLIDMLDPLGRFRRYTGFEPEDLYNLSLKRGWTLGMSQELKLLQAMIRLGHATLVQRLQRHWQRDAPDLLVSLIPNFNRALGEALRRTRPDAPFVTVLTDLADHPPRFWIEPGAGQHLVCGTNRAVAQARAAGVAEDHIHRSSGMILRPDFHAPMVLDRDAERERLGLDPRRATGVVMFGGQGSSVMLSIARALPDVQLVLMCGHHQALAERLRAEPAAAPRAVVGFTAEVRRHLMLGDFFIGKPGPGSLSEAVHLGLPVVTVRNALTMPQERYNTEWVLELQLGRVAPSWRAVRGEVAALLQDLDTYRSNVRCQNNRAVFEALEVFDALLVASTRVQHSLPLAA